MEKQKIDKVYFWSVVVVSLASLFIVAVSAIPLLFPNLSKSKTSPQTSPVTEKVEEKDPWAKSFAECESVGGKLTIDKTSSGTEYSFCDKDTGGTADYYVDSEGNITQPKQ